ncbi:MAG: carboxypeptidase regulatory-like domain-containing protein [Planctomycetota bacterium]|jgi:protocatechuate 3,4-dioxygenase beta subunit
MARNSLTLRGAIIGLFIGVGVILAAEKGGAHLRFSLAGAADGKPVTVTVTGKITDDKTGKPVAGASVRGNLLLWKYQGPELFDKAAYQETRTNQQGSYELTFVTRLTTSGPQKGEDSICVYAYAPGYESRPHWVKPYPTQQKTDFPDINIALQKGKLVKGKVVDEDKKPIEGAAVQIDNSRSGAWGFFAALGKTSTNKQGEFEIWCSTDRGRVIGSDPWLSISKEGYGMGFYWDILSKDSMGTLILPRGGTVRGRVVDTNGKGVANCEVSVRGLMVAEINKTMTGPEGRYEFKGIPGDPSYIAFYTRKNKKYSHPWAEVTVYARKQSQVNLRDVPQYKITAKEGKVVAGPDLVVGGEAGVAGKLIPSKTTFGLKGLLVRLDYEWSHMVEADAEGNFLFPYVQPGKHRLTAYLPNNLRGDRGIGHTNVVLQPGKSIPNARIQLETLTEARVQILDAKGNPLEGIAAGATWSKSGDGFWTEGTKSDKEGRAVLYLYPGQVQYVRGFDHSERSLVAEGFEEVKPKAGQVIDNVRITMVSTASIHGRVTLNNSKSLDDLRLLCNLKYADGIERKRGIKVDTSGRFEIDRLVPGVVSVTVQTRPLELEGSPAGRIEIEPGENKDLGEIVIKKVSDDRWHYGEKDWKEKEIAKAQKYAKDHPEVITKAARKLFEAIRKADYENGYKNWKTFLSKDVEYQVYKWADVWSKWVCDNFKKNPIVSVEIGEVFQDKKDRFAVYYKLTLKDGTVLENDLPFVYLPVPQVWMGVQGLDWHLQKKR